MGLAAASNEGLPRILPLSSGALGPGVSRSTPVVFREVLVPSLGGGMSGPGVSFSTVPRVTSGCTLLLMIGVLVATFSRLPGASLTKIWASEMSTSSHSFSSLNSLGGVTFSNWFTASEFSKVSLEAFSFAELCSVVTAWWFLFRREPLEATPEANSTLTLAGFSFGIHFPPKKLPQVGHLGGLCLVTYVNEHPGLVHAPWPRRVYVVV